MFLLVMIILVLSNCAKKALSEEEFISRLSANGFELEKIELADKTNLSHVLIARKDDYQFEFGVADDIDKANYLFNSQKRIIEDNKGNVNTVSSKSMRNYSKYSQTSNGMYRVVSRIDNTMLYVEASDSRKKEIDGFLKTIDY